MAGVREISAHPVLARAVTGDVIAADVPLSFWGGFDPDSGVIIDQRHPLAGECAIGRVLVIPAGRGSCSGSGVLLESIQNGTAPAAIITARVDPIIGLGAVLGDELCGNHPAVLVVAEEDRRRLFTGMAVSIADDGRITILDEL